MSCRQLAPFFFVQTYIQNVLMRIRTNNISNGLPSHITNPAPNTIAICIAMGFIFNFLKIRVSVVQHKSGQLTNDQSAANGIAPVQDPGGLGSID